MKRSREQSLSFFNTRMTSSRGDERELYRTPVALVDSILCSLFQKHPELIDKTWIDPCAADGLWVERSKLLGVKKSISYDIVPLNSSVIKQDFLLLDSIPANSFIIGNPPFSLVKQFVKKALSLTDTCYFLGGSALLTGALSSSCSLLHRFEGAEGRQTDVRSKAVFTDTSGNGVLVWTCGCLFDRNSHQKFERVNSKVDGTFRVGVYNYCVPDDRVVAISAKNIYKDLSSVYNKV